MISAKPENSKDERRENLENKLELIVQGKVK